MENSLAVYQDSNYCVSIKLGISTLREIETYIPHKMLHPNVPRNIVPRRLMVNTAQNEGRRYSRTIWWDTMEQSSGIKNRMTCRGLDRERLESQTEGSHSAEHVWRGSRVSSRWVAVIGLSLCLKCKRCGGPAGLGLNSAVAMDTFSSLEAGVCSRSLFVSLHGCSSLETTTVF